MNELRSERGIRSHYIPNRSFAVSPLPSDWSVILLESLPQEPAKNLGELVWNGYKKDVWGKFGSESLLGFELLRMAARDPDMPDGLRLLANILAAFCAIEGYGTTVEGLRREEQTRRVTKNNNPPNLRSLPAWSFEY